MAPTMDVSPASLPPMPESLPSLVGSLMSQELRAKLMIGKK